jgi:cation transport ATPase
MLTVDNHAIGKMISTPLSLIEVKAGLIPQDKLEAIKSLRRDMV